MLIRIVVMILAVLFLVPSLVLAHGSSPAAQPADQTAEPPDADGPVIEERLKALEEGQVELYHTLAEKKEAGLASSIAKRITISGLLEMEASFENLDFAGGESESTSDLVVATAQLGFGVELNEYISGDLVYLFEEDETDPPDVDVAVVNLRYGPWSGRVGRQYVPFGVFHTHFITDPLTLELGETRETAVLAGFNHPLFSLAGYVFNGDADKTGKEDQISDWGSAVAFFPWKGVEIGAGYLSDLADSNADLVDEYQHQVPGWTANTLIELGIIGFSGEILGATEAFDAADLDADGNGSGDQPLTWNLEIAFYPRENIEMALRYEGSKEFFGYPEQQYGADVSWRPWKYTTLSLEYLRGDFDSGFAERDAAGNPLEHRNLVTAQLAFEF